MRIGIFYQADNQENSSQLLEALSRERFKGSAYAMGRNWEMLFGEELQFNFASLTHYIVIPTVESFLSRWLPFVTGIAFGGGKGIAFYLPGDNFDTPPYLSQEKRFAQLSNLLTWLEDERDLWTRTNQIEAARETLISIGIGINEDNMAARAGIGDTESVLNFLKVGYSPNTVSQQGTPLLCIATRNGHREIANLLIERNADVNVLSQDRGNSPLMEAAVRGDTAIVSTLLRAGAEPDLLSKSGQSALMMAVGEGHAEIVKLLFEAGADPAKTDALGMSARKYAEIFQHKEILQILNGGN